MTPNEQRRDDRAGDAADGDRMDARRQLIRFGAVAAIASAALALTANLSEIAGWFAPDETREIVQETREAIVDTDSKVEELLILLRNQAAASGVDLNIESEVSIRNAVKAIVASSNASKRAALSSLEEGDVVGASESLLRVATEESLAADRTSAVAAETWLEAGALFFTYDFDKAIHAYGEAARLAPDNADTLVRLGRVYLRAGYPEDARRVLNESLMLAPEPRIQSGAYHGLGMLERQLGDYAASLACLRQALELARSAGGTAEEILALNELGELERARGNAGEALETLTRALNLAQAQKDRLLEAEILQNLGILASDSKEYDEADRLIRAALAIHEANSDQASVANSLGKLGAVALLSGELEDAERQLLKAIALKEALHWDASVVYDLMNLSTLTAGAENFGAADDYLARAEELAVKHELRELTPVITYNRGEMARNKGDLESACRHYGAAAPELEAMGSQYAGLAGQQLSENCQ